jgi:predicted ATPase/class 3 adenylate cyclase
MSESSLPRGIVTFLFTDIEGSTELLLRLNEDYAQVLMRHRALVDAAIATHGGVVVRTEGDAYFAAFEKASTAVAAAVEAQRALAQEEWPDGVRLRVRMGLHSGEVEVVDGDYVGLSVHVTARVATAAHGGQILITETTADMAGKPATLDLGHHVLKDLGEFRLLQIRASGLEESFPALRTMSTPNNLPASVDTFVGRQTEMADLMKAIGQHRLVTLTGPGGSGKTRLALETASSLLTEFPDGVWFVPLASTGVEDTVAETVAQVLRVGDRADELITDTLEKWLRDRRALLILDNCEHVVQSVVEFCERFLPACRQLYVLTTSRELLGARGEDAIATPPLATGEDMYPGLGSDAAELFVERARAAVPNLELSDVDLRLVDQVCRQLDGLPLAIELAAARLRSLSLAQLESRLDDRFRLLVGSRHAKVARQRTLEAVVAWSYELLDVQEQQVFRRVAVFPDHFALEMAEAVVSDNSVDIADVMNILGQLVDKSLVTTTVVGGVSRYRLLETLRQYGAERLREDGSTERFRRRMFDWAMHGVEGLSTAMRTPAQDDALREATLNASTYRSAMQWAAAHGQPVAALRIASLVPVIHHRGDRRAAILEYLEAAQAQGAVDDLAAGEAWAAIGNIAFEQADAEYALVATRRAVEHFLAAGENRLAAWSQYLGIHSAWLAGHLDEMDHLIPEVIRSFRDAGDDMGLGYCLWVASLRTADLDEAESMAEEADRLLRRAAVPMGIAHNVEGRGIIAMERGELAEAGVFVSEAVRMFAAYENLGCTAHSLEAVAVILGRAGSSPSLAVELVAAAEEFRLQSGQGHRPWEIRARVGSLEDHIATLSEDETAAARERGRELQLSTAARMASQALQSL